MHEYSIVNSLLDNCIKIANDNQAEEITKINIAISSYSNIEKKLLKRAFDFLKLEFSLTKKSILDISKQDLLLQCHDCSNNFSSKDLMACPKCKSAFIKVVEGQDIKLLSIDVN